MVQRSNQAARFALHRRRQPDALCGGHHRAHHDGKLAITGKAPALSFESPHVGRDCDVARDVESALVTMGYSRREAAAAVKSGLERTGPSPDLDALLRAALRAAASA